MAGITSFTATPLAAGSAVRFNWTLDASLNATDVTDVRLYLDMSLSDNFLREVEVIPFVDASGNLITSYIVDELVNGQEYRVLLEVLVAPGSVFTSHLTIVPSTRPNPVFIKVGQDLDSGFYLKLFSDAELTTPLVRNSADDGFSPLTGAFVIISNSLTGTSVYLDNSGNRLYNTHNIPVQLDASFGEHEVSVRVVNARGSSKTSATANLVIGSSITAVNVVRVAEQIAIDPSANATAPYNVARMVLAWNAPDYIGSPALTEYRISRAEFDGSGVLGPFSVLSTQLVANFVNALSYIHDASYSFVDTVVTGNTYVYNIVGVNANGSSEAAVYGSDLLNTRSFRAVAWPTIDTVTSVPGNLSSTISSTITGGFDPSANIEFAVNVAGKGITRSTNPVLITGLNNLQRYAYNVSGFAPSPNVDKVYATPQHTLLYTTPIEAPPSIVAFSGSAVDASANPLNGAVRLSWELSSNLFNFVSNEYSISTRIFRKLASAPDASYTLVTDVSSNSLLNSFVNSSLTNGTVYNYVVRTVYTNSEVGGELLGAMSAPITVKPFSTPAKPSSISITSNNSMVDLSYNYTDSAANTSGSAIVGHRFVLLNMNNGRTSTALTGLDLSVDVLDGFNTVSKAGTLANIFGNLNPGTKYSLSLDSFVVENGVRHYSTRNGVALSEDSTTFTVPSGLTNVTVSNVDGSGVALSSSNINGTLRLSWSYPEGQDASGITFRIVNGVHGATIQNAINSLTADVTGLSVGVASASGFKVLPILNNVSAPLNTAQAVTGTPIFIPAAVSSLTILGRNSTSIDFSFNGVTYHGGMDASKTKYLVELLRDPVAGLEINDVFVDQFEMDHAAGSLSGNFSNLSTNFNYKIRITTKALNPMVEDGYISSTPFILDDVVVYDAPQNIALFEAKPSDAAIVSKWQPILSLPAGLTFYAYRLAIKLAINNIAAYKSIDLATQQVSVYTVSTLLDPSATSLSNGVEYSVRMQTVYTDANSAQVLSSWSPTLLVTPQTAPLAPANLNYTLNSTGTGITLSWDHDATPTHYSIVVESVSTSDYHFEADNVSISSLTFDNLTNKYMYAGVTGLVPGRNYLARVYAEFQTMVSSIVYYSSSDPDTITVTTYETPSVPRNLRAIMMDGAFQPIWDLPSNTGGQGETLNYDIYLSTGAPDASGVFAPVTSATLQDLNRNSISGGSSGVFRVSHAQMVAGIKFITLTNFQRYSFTVKSIILNSGIVVAASGLASLDRLYPRAPPSPPTITSAIIQTPTQSNIQMVMNSDPSFNINKYQLFRKIIDASSNLVISPYTLIAEKTFPALGFNTIAQGAERIWTVVDDNTVSSPFWLDGNKFQYKFVVYHNDDNINSASGTNGDDMLEVETSPIIKIFKPFVCGANGLPVSPGVMVADMSLNTLSFLVNKAGSEISSVNAVLLADEVVAVRSGTPGTTGITVTGLTNALVQKSVGNNGGTAANQVVRVTLDSLNFVTLDDVLAVVGNAVGTTIAVWPSDGAFSDLRN